MTAYLALHEHGRLAERAAQALQRLSACVLCARRCGADRTQGPRRAVCQVGRHARVARWGDGRIVFSGCNLRCLYCQDHPASWQGEGQDMDAQGLAGIMLALQQQGARAVELVSPSHVVAQVLEALAVAASQGLNLPLVWNSGGYDSVEGLALLDGIIDLYMPDIKYGNDTVARMCSGVPDYLAANRAALAEMRRQVGDAVMDDGGRPRRGLLVRHLVLPNDMAGSEAALASLPPGVVVEISGDYRPAFRAFRHGGLNRPAEADEVRQVVELARGMGLKVM